MANNTVITIGRHFGSGGKEVGKRVADALGYTFYDEELVTLAAKKSNIDESVLNSVDEKASKSLLYSLVMGAGLRGLTSPMYYEMPINDKLFIAQSDVIKRAASEGPCVIVGRCADYVLRDYENVVNIFITASIEDRISEIRKRKECQEDEALKIIENGEKSRSTYYNYYTGKKWGDSSSYDLCVNTSLLGIEGTEAYIKEFIEKVLHIG